MFLNPRFQLLKGNLMRPVILFSLLWVLMVNSAHAEVDLDSAGKQTEAMSQEGVRPIPAESKWYIGEAVGIGDINDWWYSQTVVDDYYQSKGYYNSGGSFWNLMIEGKVYTAYRARTFMDVEFAYSLSDVTFSETYQSGSNTIWSKRDVTIHALSASALLRPEEGYGHLLYLKFGGHLSQLQVSKRVTGSPANLNTIAAGDNMPEDGISTGVGGLIGIGVDIRTGKVGAIRLELSRMYRVGGTSIRKDAFNLGYQINLK